MAGKHDKIKDKDRFSILVPSLDKCCLCGSADRVAKHEVFYGPHRDKSKQDGMIIPLCWYHHNGSSAGVHYNKDLDIRLKQNAEKIWIETYTDKNLDYDDRIQLFIDRYGKNYL